MTERKGSGEHSVLSRKREDSSYARPEKSASNTFGQFATVASNWLGCKWAFLLAIVIIVVWGISGPIFHFSDTWQLVINTGTTIVTFLMVFLIQRTQNKDALAIHLKLNEIVAAMQGASNRLVDVENLTEAEIALLHKHYQKLVTMAKHDASLTETHSIEEAEHRHEAKQGKRRGTG